MVFIMVFVITSQLMATIKKGDNNNNNNNNNNDNND